MRVPSAVVKTILPAAIAAFLCLAVGCGGGKRVAKDPSRDVLYTVRPLDEESLPLTLPGRLKNENPHKHAPVLAYVPVTWVRPAGEQVSAGDSLIEFDASSIVDWQKSLELEKAVAESGMNAARLLTQQQLASLKLARKTLQAQQRVLLTQLEATRAVDGARKEILRLLVEQASTELDAAKRHLDRVRSLEEQGILSKSYREAAEDRYTSAQQALRVPAFDFARQDAGGSARTRDLLNLDVAMLGLDLGTGADGEDVFDEVAVLETLRDLQESTGSARIRALDLMLAKYRQMADQNVMTANVPGVFLPSSEMYSHVQVGGKYAFGPLGAIVQSKDLVVELFLPEKYRSVVRAYGRADKRGGHAVVTLPSYPGRVFPGELRSISTIPEDREHGQVGGYRCAVVLDSPGKELRHGMTATARLNIPVGPHFVKVPKWFVRNPTQPVVAMADGGTRPVEGFVLGSVFIVTSGLQPGDVIRARSGRGRRPPLRLTGKIEPEDPLHLAFSLPWHSGSHPHSPFVISKLAPDGLRVKQGDFLAELDYMWLNWSWEQRLATFDIEKKENEARLAAARAEAETRLRKAYTDWKRSELAANKARISYLASFDEALEGRSIRAEVDRNVSELALREAERDAAYVLSDESGLASRHDRLEQELRTNLAAVSRRQLVLAHLVTLREQDWLSVAESEADMIAARLDARAARGAYSVARKTYYRDLREALHQFRRNKTQYEAVRAYIEGMKLYAPRDGRVFRYAEESDIDEDHIVELGDEWDDEGVLVMPVGTGWRFEVEVPSALYGTFEEGQKIPFTIPGFDDSQRQGTITWVAPFFEQGVAAVDNLFAPDVKGLAEPVFRMRVSFDAEPEEEERIAPGLVARVDL